MGENNGRLFEPRYIFGGVSNAKVHPRMRTRGATRADVDSNACTMWEGVSNAKAHPKAIGPGKEWRASVRPRVY